MPFNTHDLGDLVKVTITFRNADMGELFDPDVVKLSVKAPNDPLVTYVYSDAPSLIRDDTGIYSMEIDANQVGDWYYRGFSTGDGQGAEERRFTVRNAVAIE